MALFNTVQKHSNIYKSQKYLCNDYKYCVTLSAIGVFVSVASIQCFQPCRLEVGCIVADSLWLCLSIEVRAFVCAQCCSCGLG